IEKGLEELGGEGYVLSQEMIHEIGRQLEQIESMKAFFSKQDHVREFRVIAAWVEDMPSQAKQIRQIRIILDERGEVLPNASPELLEISGKISQAENRLNR